MGTGLTLGEVLGKAIQKEVESWLLYINLSQRTSDQSAKDAFKELANQEQGHQKLLERYLRGELEGGTLSSTAVVDYKIAERLDQPEISPGIKLKEIFILAANREKAAHEFYLGLAQIHPSGKTKLLIEGLAAQELGHKHKLEFLYTEVAFPQTDGG